jgi:type II secretory pathway pseudopilin PulG
MLIEVVLAITIFGAVGTAVVLGVRTAHISSSLVANHSNAERLARNQMESVFNQAYKPPEAEAVAYDTLAEANACGSSTGYSICAVALELQASDSFEGTVERVVVTVSVDGQPVLVLETLRAN